MQYNWILRRPLTARYHTASCLRNVKHKDLEEKCNVACKYANTAVEIQIHFYLNKNNFLFVNFLIKLIYVYVYV